MAVFFNTSKIALSLLLMVGTSTLAHADAAKDAVATELAFIKRVFQTGYAPAQWKKDHLGWDLQTEYDKALGELANKSEVSAADYRQIISGLLSSPSDYHVGYRFQTTESATLPFTVNGINGRYFIVWIDSEKLNSGSFPFSVGDEILTWGGRPINDVVMEIKAQLGHAEDSTDLRLAEITLTRRSAARAIAVPQGQFEIVVQQASGTKLTRQLSWDYTPESITWNPWFDTLDTRAFANIPKPFSRPQMTWGHYETMRELETAENPFQIGGRKSWVPELGPKIWESADTDRFHAYIYRNEEGKLIGYIRIPSYDGAEGKSFVDFKAIIQKFQAATDALVIDEVNNPGGSVFYVYALMSVLSDQPIKVPDHSIALWPDEVRENVDLVESLRLIKNDEDAVKAFGAKDLDGFPVTYQFGLSTLAFSRSVVDAWKGGARQTQPLFLWGVDKVNPDNEVNYTKPIVVLINELDFSGGDFFPAILQDNKRAKTFGQRTAGAGGYVLSVKFPSSLGLVQFSFTGSIARRVNNQPIENLGVTPDIPYQYTVDDLKGSFQDYKKALNAAVSKEISGK